MPAGNTSFSRPSAASKETGDAHIASKQRVSGATCERNWSEGGLKVPIAVSSQFTRQVGPGARDTRTLNWTRLTPSLHHLNYAVMFMRRHGFWHRQASPDHRAGSRQPFGLPQKRFRLRRLTGNRHAKMLHGPFQAADRSMTSRMLAVPRISVQVTRCHQIRLHARFPIRWQSCSGRKSDARKLQADARARFLKIAHRRGLGRGYAGEAGPRARRRDGSESIRSIRPCSHPDLRKRRSHGCRSSLVPVAW